SLCIRLRGIIANCVLAPPCKNMTAWLCGTERSSRIKVSVSCTISSNSLLLWDISKMDNPVSLKLITAREASSKTSLGKMLGPAPNLCFMIFCVIDGYIVFCFRAIYDITNPDRLLHGVLPRGSAIAVHFRKQYILQVLYRLGSGVDAMPKRGYIRHLRHSTRFVLPQFP